MSKKKCDSIKEIKMKLEKKICGVCGDRALGFNFNAITCESCKAFFRRNATVVKEFKCPFSNHCEITLVTRKFCPKCRLDKCFAIGMCKDLIMSEEDKQNKRKKILENQNSKRMGGGAFKKGFNKVKKTTIIRNVPTQVESTIQEENKNERKCEEEKKNLYSLQSILKEAIRLEYQTLNHNKEKELNDIETAKLNELIIANKVLTIPLDDDLEESYLWKTKGKNLNLESGPEFLDVINLTAVAIRRVIKMAKKIKAFKNLCEEDQVALLKGGSTEIMMLHSALNFDAKNKSWQIRHTKQNINLNIEVLKLAKNNAYEEHEKFIKTFDASWRSDENIILIMCAISLFTPERPKTIHKDVIKLEQNSYYYLLRRYLESIYTGCEAKSTFLKLMRKISELRLLNEEVVNAYLDVNPSKVEPLLIEIFDLKH